MSANKTVANKTVANSASVDEFLGGLDDQNQAEDSRHLVQIMQQVSGQPAVMWGGAIIGFGSHHYTYQSGRQGDWPIIGFSPRKGKIALYITFDDEKLTRKFPNLGNHTESRGCIYIKRMTDVDLGQLTAMIAKGHSDGFVSPVRADGKEQLV